MLHRIVDQVADDSFQHRGVPPHHRRRSRQGEAESALGADGPEASDNPLRHEAQIHFGRILWGEAGFVPGQREQIGRKAGEPDHFFAAPIQTWLDTPPGCARV